MQSLLMVGLGGFLGANARYILSTWVARHITKLLGLSLPVGTLFVNATGSLLLALVITWWSSRVDVPRNIQLLVGMGFFGSYTTFSTFANESIALLQHGQWGDALGNIVLTNTICLAGVIVGVTLGQRFFAAG